MQRRIQQGILRNVSTLEVLEACLASRAIRSRKEGELALTRLVIVILAMCVGYIIWNFLAEGGC